MKPLLLIMNPRTIPQAMDAFNSLDIDRLYMSGYTEQELNPIVHDTIERTDYTHYLLTSDDLVVTQPALDAVLQLLADGHPVASGWANLDSIEPYGCIKPTPLQPHHPTSKGEWDFMHYSQILSHPEQAIPTFFSGFTPTGMTRALWQQHPYQGNSGTDYDLCLRLQTAHVPIVAAKQAFCHHLKTLWGTQDEYPHDQPKALTWATA